MNAYYKKDGRITLEFPYDERTVVKVQGIPAAKWNKKERVWELPPTKETVETLKELFNLRVQNLDLSPKFVHLSRYKFKTAPFAHQMEAILDVFGKFGLEVGDNPYSPAMKGEVKK